MRGLIFKNKYTIDTIKMAWPAVLEFVSVSIAGLIDTYMVSSEGAAAVAAVGITLNPKFVGISLFLALNVAVSALVSRRRGEGRRKEANEIMLSAVVFTIISALIISLVFVVFAAPIMHFSGSDETTHELATKYFKIIMGGIIFNVVSTVINAAQRGAGNTRIAMRTNLIANGINIVCNYLLIQGNLGFPAMGIEGAAIATVAGSVVAFIMSTMSLFEGGYLDIRYTIREKLGVKIDEYKSLVKIGYSVFIEQILLRVGLMAVSIMAAYQGSKAMAAHQVAMNFMGLAFSVGDGMQAALVALIGRSLGADMTEDAVQYRRCGKKIGFFLSAILTVIYILCSKPIYQLHFDDEEIINLGVKIMLLLSVIVLFQVGQVIDMGCLRGAGDVLYTTIVSTIGATIVRPLVSYLACYIFKYGIMGIWIGILFDQISRMLFTYIRFKRDNWTKIKI